MAFEALPDTVDERYFRGDSACYETDLLQWLSAEDRHSEPGGRIGFAVNAAWLKLTALSYNVASAIRRLCLNGQERTARFKRVPAADGARGRPDESRRVRDAVTAVRQRTDDRADPRGVRSVWAGRASQLQPPLAARRI